MISQRASVQAMRGYIPYIGNISWLKTNSDTTGLDLSELLVSLEMGVFSGSKVDFRRLRSTASIIRTDRGVDCYVNTVPNQDIQDDYEQLPMAFIFGGQRIEAVIKRNWKC